MYVETMRLLALHKNSLLLHSDVNDNLFGSVGITGECEAAGAFCEGNPNVESLVVVVRLRLNH